MAAGRLPPRHLGLTLPLPQRASPGPMHRLPGSRPASEDLPRLHGHSGPQGPSRRWGPGPEPSLPPITWRGISGRRPAIQTSSALAPAASAWTERRSGPSKKNPAAQRRFLLACRSPSLGAPTCPPGASSLPPMPRTYLCCSEAPSVKAMKGLPVPRTQEAAVSLAPAAPAVLLLSGASAARLSPSRDETSSRAAGRQERKLQEMGGRDGARDSPDHTCNRDRLRLSLRRLAG